MRLAVVLIGLALVAAGCGQDDEQTAAPPKPPAGAALADLKITVDKDGDGAGAPKTTELRCDTPADSKACAALAVMTRSTFRPTPGTVACTEQYGGPQIATIKGTFHGEAVNARFSRENGCAIARWNAVSRLLGAAG
jgi:hypothetical protein